MLGVTTHHYSAPFHGDADKAMDVARNALLSLGFEIVHETPGELVAEGPGMHSNQQPALLGASDIHLRVEPGEIRVEAVLGGAATMKRFVVLFPPGLVAFLLLFFLFMPEAEGKLHLIHLLWILPWFLIAPLLANLMERGPIRAVERLVRGMARAGEAK